MRENNWKTNGFLDGYRRQARLYSFCTSTLLATIAESQTSCHFVFISEVEEEDLTTPTTVVFWNKAGLHGGWANTSLWTGQTRWCFIFSMRTSVVALRRGLAGAIYWRELAATPTV